MNVPTHASWCAHPDSEHVTCRWPVAEVPTPGEQHAFVGLHKTRGTRAIITLLLRQGSRDRLVTLDPPSADELAAALSTAASMLRDHPNGH